MSNIVHKSFKGDAEDDFLIDRLQDLIEEVKKGNVRDCAIVFNRVEADGGCDTVYAYSKATEQICNLIGSVDYLKFRLLTMLEDS